MQGGIAPIPFSRNAREFLRRALSVREGTRGLPLAISFLFLLTTTAWILFEHQFLEGWGPIRKDIFWAVLSAASLYFLAGFGLSAIRRSTAALEESEDIRSRILETSASGFLVVAPAGEITYANPKAAELLGIPRNEIVGKNYRELPWEPSFPGRRSRPGNEPSFLAGARTAGGVHGAELAIRRPDGRRVILSVNTSPLRDRNGNVAGMIASFFDVTARREEEDLQLRKLYLAVEQSPSAIAITDVAGRIEYANPMFVRLTGYPLEALLREEKPCPDDISPHEFRVIREAIAAGKEWRGDYWNRRRNGELYWESAALTPVRDAGGGIAHFLWVAEDVTDKRLAEEGLRESRERYRSIVENINDLVWETDPDSAFTYVSPRIREVLGYEPEEVLGKTPLDLVPKDEADRIRELIAGYLSEGRQFEHIETVHRHRDGTLVVLNTSGIPFCDATGSLRGWRGVSRDITGLKRDEEALRQSEERFRQIFEQNEDALILFRSGTDEILNANPAALALYGYTLEELRQGGPSLFLDAEARPGALQGIRGIGPSAPLLVEEAIHVRKDGTRIHVALRVKSVLLAEGHVSYCTIHDITARVRAEEQAKARQAQLIHANRMSSLGTMVSGIAHEINNPNNLIMFNAPIVRQAWQDAGKILEAYHRENGDFLLGGLPYSEMRNAVPKLVQGISEASWRIRNFVENLKGFARPESRDPDSDVPVASMIRSAIGILDHEIVKWCDDFRAEYPPESLMVHGCSQELEQVLINLVHNALQALPDRSRSVRVSVEGNGASGTVEIRVRDEGTGMPPDVLRKLTRPFFSTKQETGGLGLGLSISRSIVERHNGELRFESEVGKGTTAAIVLPGLVAGGEPRTKVRSAEYCR